MTSVDNFAVEGNVENDEKTGQSPSSVGSVKLRVTDIPCVGSFSVLSACLGVHYSAPVFLTGHRNCGKH
jgi:hypothetical protein